MKRPRGEAGGFTLIEVVGAVAIVGIVFLVLSTATFRGIAAEGTAHRRLEASLVADDALAEVEIQMLMSLPIEIDSTTLGDLDGDGFAEYAVIGDMAPYDPTAELQAALPSASTAPFRGNDTARPTSGGEQDAEMQRVRIDVFLANEFGEPDEDDIPLASRTAFILETATINMLAPSRGAAPPAATGGGGEDGGDEEAAFDAGADALEQRP